VPLLEAVAILRDIASGLEYAHAHGVVHRDIKPENVLLSGRTAVVTDFGIAKALAAAKTGDLPPDGSPSDGEATLTQLGTTIGTPAYMAPEQAAGDAVDFRSDLYAWGVVAYEVLSGTHPFAGSTTSREFLTAHLGHTPDALGLRAPTTPPELAELVMRCLAKAPHDRPSSAAMIVEALSAPLIAQHGELPRRSRLSRRKSLGAAAAVLVVLAGTSALVATLRTGSVRTAMEDGLRAESLAVLPFENLGDSADAYFADGVSDAVRGKLASLPNLAVIARTSSVHYRGGAASPNTIGRELGVRYLLTGTVRWTRAEDGSSRVQVSPELIELARGDGPPTIRWQQPLESPLTDLFDVQADIATRVAEALDMAFASGDRQRIAERPTRNLEAYDLYLRAEELTQGWAASDPRTMRGAIALYERAVTLDSGFAVAWARLAQARTFAYVNSYGEPRLALQARHALDRALLLAPDDPIVNVALGQFYGDVENDQVRALDTYARAGRIAPNNVEVLHFRVATERAIGRGDSALAYALRAARLDPRSARALRIAGRVLAAARRFSEADSMFLRADALSPDNVLILHDRVQVRLSQGDLAGARALTQPSAVTIPQRRVAAVMAVYSDLYWALDSMQLDLLLRTEPDDFDGDVGGWALALAQAYDLRGDSMMVRRYADSARVAFEAQVAADPDDSEGRALLGLSLAYRGSFEEALREARAAVALIPLERDRGLGAYVALQLARIHVMAGDTERAIDTLEPLLRIPWYVTPAWLRIDPAFRSLRGHPRFERLVRDG
jgi:serine/threonine-protein kinase